MCSQLQDESLGSYESEQLEVQMNEASEFSELPDCLMLTSAQLAMPKK